MAKDKAISSPTFHLRLILKNTPALTPFIFFPFTITKLPSANDGMRSAISNRRPSLSLHRFSRIRTFSSLGYWVRANPCHTPSYRHHTHDDISVHQKPPHRHICFFRIDRSVQCIINRTFHFVKKSALACHFISPVHEFHPGYGHAGLQHKPVILRICLHDSRMTKKTGGFSCPLSVTQ